jgi:hypothetical protein
MTMNKLNFLSSTLFVANSSIEFKTFRKEGLNKVITNYKKSVTTRWYLISNIFTALNHSKQSCSNDDLFLEDIHVLILKEVFLRNGYLEHILDTKISMFLCSLEKQERPEVDFNFKIEYTNPAVEFHLRQLYGRIKNFIPNFNVRFAYKTITIDQIIVKDGKSKFTK